MRVAVRTNEWQTFDETRTPSKGACGWVDLVHALDFGGPALLKDMAAVLGWEEHSPSIQRIVQLNISEAIIAKLTTEPPPEPEVVSKPLVDVPFWRLETVEYLQAPKPTNNGPELVAALPEWTERPAAAIPQPLARWPELLPRLRGTLARKMESLMWTCPPSCAASGKAIAAAVAASLVSVLGRDLACHRRPQRQVDALLAGSSAGSRTTRAIPSPCGAPCADRRRFGSPTLRRSASWRGSTLSPTAVGWLASVLGDLGGLAREDVGVSANWERLGQCLADAGCQAVALLPQPAAWCSPMIGRYWRLLSWERGPGALIPNTAGERSKPCCICSRRPLGSNPVCCDCADLLGLRQRPNPWYGSIRRSPACSSVAATLNPEDLKRWRTGFEDQSEPLRKQVLYCIRAWRAHLPSEVYLSEAALLDSDSQALLPAGEREAVPRFFCRS